MSREEATEVIKAYRDNLTNSASNQLDGDIEAFDIAVKALEQETKTGHWILTDDDFVYCSECEDSYYPRPIDASWYYCPHCGAKMIEPQESEG